MKRHAPFVAVVVKNRRSGGKIPRREGGGRAADNNDCSVLTFLSLSLPPRCWAVPFLPTKSRRSRMYDNVVRTLQKSRRFEATNFALTVTLM